MIHELLLKREMGLIYPICMRLPEAMISLLLIIQRQHHIVVRYAYR